MEEGIISFIYTLINVLGSLVTITLIVSIMYLVLNILYIQSKALVYFAEWIYHRKEFKNWLKRRDR